VTIANTIRQIYDRYPEMLTKGDVEGIVALYAADATIEDPIGSEVRRGTDAIRAFYEAAAGTVVMKRSGPPCIAGLEAATPLIILMGPEGQRNALPVISAMVFTEDGKIVSMRAYWSFDDMRPATPEDEAL
jgi:steroid delta-isomerase